MYKEYYLIFRLFQHSYYVRCIKPNNEKKMGMFDEQFVLRQLNTSSTVAYAKFIRFGYPKRIAIQQILDPCKVIENKLMKMCSDRSNFCSKILLSIGFKLSDFKIGNDTIFFRSNKFHLMEEFFSDFNAASSKSETEITISVEALKSTPNQRRTPKYSF